MNHSQLMIRQEDKRDYSFVFELNQLAFGQDNEAKLVDTLRKNPTAFVPELSIVALKANKLVGHILFTKIQIIDKKLTVNESLALAPMAVSSEHQKNGIGGKLINHGLEVAQKLGFKSVIVLGHKHYHPKFGFEPAHKWNICAPFDVPANVFMAIELERDGLKNVSGMVQYPAEFEAV